jgi:hypothetical protein
MFSLRIFLTCAAGCIQLTLTDFDVCLSVHRCICVEKKTQLDATEWFIALIICPTCFGHFYAHHQEFDTVLVLLPHMVCNALVAGGPRSGAGQQLCVRDEGSCPSSVPHPGRITAALHLTADHQQPRHYTPYAAITQV